MRKTTWFLIILATAAAIYTGVWYATAVFVREQTVQWLEARRRQGLIVAHETPVLAGFPLKAETIFPAFNVSAPGKGEAAGWAWHMPALRIYARPFVFNRFFVDLAGAHRLSGIEAQDTPISVDQALMAFTLGARGIESVGITIANAVTAHGAVDHAGANIVLNDKATHIDLTASQIALPDVLPTPLSRTLETLKVTLDIPGTLGGGAPLPDVLEAWRIGGGTVEIRDFAFDWPPVSGTGSGTLALDRALQPEGAFSGTFRGFLDVVDMLVGAGRMQPREASLARGALILLSTTPHEGAAPELKVAVTVQGRKVYAGPVTLTELPPITWRQNVIVP
jgi:hypothetical protein